MKKHTIKPHKNNSEIEIYNIWKTETKIKYIVISQI